MTGQDLYEFFKQALDFTGVGFRCMEQAEITINGNKLCVKANGMGCIIEVPKDEEAQNG